MEIGKDSVLVQELEMKFDETRFRVMNVPFSEWKDDYFVKWGDERADDWDECWNDGMHMYF